MKLIIVEDIGEYRDSIAFLSDDFFKEVFPVSNLKDAQQVIEAEMPDIAIVDIRLSEEDTANKDGLKLLNWIKGRALKTKVIMISAYRDFDYAIEALNAGAEYFLKKPVRNAELEGILKKLTNSL